jgi:hypothetical protein
MPKQRQCPPRGVFLVTTTLIARPAGGYLPDKAMKGELGMHRQRNFLLLVTLAAAVATPALGQAVAPTVGPADSGTQGTVSVPDFSGIWANRYGPGFGLPASGPGPLRWRRPKDLGLVADYTNPILKPHAAEVVRKHGEMELSGVNSPTTSNQCWPSGVPYIFFQPLMQMLQQPGKITFLYFRDHEIRQVRLNQPHPARVTPAWYGDSIGHYEGDTLVIDTVGIKADRQHAMVDQFGTPYTEALHVVERYRLIDYDDAKAAIQRNIEQNVFIIPGYEVNVDPNYRGKHLQLQFTVEDEGMFTMPWSARVTYAPHLGEWEEHVCAETTHEFYGAAVPTANKLDF